jgi:hypothetical protein
VETFPFFSSIAAFKISHLFLGNSGSAPDAPLTAEPLLEFACFLLIAASLWLRLLVDSFSA